MDRRTAKEFLHLRDWFDKVEMLLSAGHGAYVESPLLQEAGDSLMMKIGEAANRLSRADVVAPAGVAWGEAIANRNWLIHQYDQIDRALTWATLAKDVPAWRAALSDDFIAAQKYLEDDA